MQRDRNNKAERIENERIAMKIYYKNIEKESYEIEQKMKRRIEWRMMNETEWDREWKLI